MLFEIVVYYSSLRSISSAVQICILTHLSISVVFYYRLCCIIRSAGFVYWEFGVQMFVASVLLGVFSGPTLPERGERNFFFQLISIIGFFFFMPFTPTLAGFDYDTYFCIMLYFAEYFIYYCVLRDQSVFQTLNKTSYYNNYTRTCSF